MADYGKRLHGHDSRAWTRTKTPIEDDYWGIDWSGTWLGAETLASAVWTIPPESGLVSSDELIIGGQITSARLAGGNVGQWELTVVATTTDSGRVRQEKFILIIE